MAERQSRLWIPSYEPISSRDSLGNRVDGTRLNLQSEDNSAKIDVFPDWIIFKSEELGLEIHGRSRNMESTGQIFKVESHHSLGGVTKVSADGSKIIFEYDSQGRGQPEVRGTTRRRQGKKKG